MVPLRGLLAGVSLPGSTANPVPLQMMRRVVLPVGEEAAAPLRLRGCLALAGTAGEGSSSAAASAARASCAYAESW